MSKSPIEQMLDSVEFTQMPGDAEQADYGVNLPVATHVGVLHLGEKSLRVFQLSNGLRVIDSNDLNEFFGGDLLENDGK